MRNLKKFEIPFIDGWGKKEVKQFSPDELVNFYVDINKSNELALINTPGLSDKISFNVSKTLGVRALYASEQLDNMHVVVGDRIYQIDQSFNPILGDYLATDRGLCYVNYNKDQLMFSDGTELIIYTPSTGDYAKVTSLNAPPKPGMISILGGRPLVNEQESDKLHIGEIYDGFIWTGNVIRLSTYAERIVAHGVIKGRLFLLGTRSGEIWYPSSTYPFIALDENITLEYGCAAPGSLYIAEGKMIWLGKDVDGVTSVVVTEGSYPQRISDDELDDKLQGFDNLSDCTGYIYRNAGITFYQLNSTENNFSFLYNFRTRTWSGLEHADLANEGRNRHLADRHAFYKSHHFVGSYEKPNIFRLNSKFYLDYDTNIARTFVTRPFYLGEKFIIHKVKVIMEQGTGYVAPIEINGANNDDIDPKLFLSISHDNGIRFGNRVEGEIGKSAKSTTDCDFFRLGYFDYGSLVFKFEHYSHTPCNIFKIEVFYEVVIYA